MSKEVSMDHIQTLANIVNSELKSFIERKFVGRTYEEARQIIKAEFFNSDHTKEVLIELLLDALDKKLRHQIIIEDVL